MESRPAAIAATVGILTLLALAAVQLALERSSLARLDERIERADLELRRLEYVEARHAELLERLHALGVEPAAPEPAPRPRGSREDTSAWPCLFLAGRSERLRARLDDLEARILAGLSVEKRLPQLLRQVSDLERRGAGVDG